MTENILLDTVRVSGFRGIKNIEVSLPRVMVLIGANNSGKTSLIKALQLACGDYSKYVSEEDFFISSNQARSNEIIIDIRIVSADGHGNRLSIFHNSWQAKFGDKIQSEVNGNQYVAVRTSVKFNDIKGSFECLRYNLKSWPDFSVWLEHPVYDRDKVTRILNMPFISIEAQRDIHYELRDKFSIVSKVLAAVEYKKTDVEEIEKLIQDLNKSAVDKSEVLKKLCIHLEQLDQSFHGVGNVEITPFPKKIRDLSKYFSVNFGESESGIFSMEYHGMGTRSWASMLTVKAFLETVAAKHMEEEEPFFPILAAEEPEAHLHPNAQKTLYHQLAEAQGQVIVSTHSPYFAAMSNINDIRALKKTSTGVILSFLKETLTATEKKILSREIISKRGEILFAKALILCEGITEEQLIPAMFELSERKTLFSLGIACINVCGKGYRTFVHLACSLGIPTYIVSDNDNKTKNEVEAQLRRLRKELPHLLHSEIFGVSYLSTGNDIEAELLNTLNLKSEIIDALVLSETKAAENSRYTGAKKKEIEALSENKLLERMRNSKASYSGFLADILLMNPQRKPLNQMIPAAVIVAIETVKRWYHT